MTRRLAIIFFIPLLYSFLAYSMAIPQVVKEDPLNKCVSFLYKEGYLSKEVYELYLLCDEDFILFHMIARGYKGFLFSKASHYWYTKSSSHFIKDLKNLLLLFFEYSFNKQYYKRVLALYFKTLHTLPGYSAITDQEIRYIINWCKHYRISLAPFVKALLIEVYEPPIKLLRSLLLLKNTRYIL